MPQPRILAPAALAVALAACGGGQTARDAKPPAPEETVVGDLVAAPVAVGQRVDSARDAHREALKRQIEAGEGASSVDE